MGALRRSRRFEPTHRARERRNLANDLDEADDGDLLERHGELHPRRPGSLAGESEHLRRGLPRRERANEPGGVEISGGLTAADEDSRRRHGPYIDSSSAPNIAC